MAARFVIASEDVINNLKTSSENKNTRKSTNLWVGIFKKWAALRNFEENLETYDVRELDNVLSKFYAEVRKENGDEYEPDSLKVMQASIDRFLREKGYPKSILRDNEFLSSKKVLEGKARNLRRDGLGKQPNKAKSLTEEEEKILWESGHLGEETLDLWRTRCGGFLLNILGYAVDKSIMKCVSKISPCIRTTTELSL